MARSLPLCASEGVAQTHSPNIGVCERTYACVDTRSTHVIHKNALLGLKVSLLSVSLSSRQSRSDLSVVPASTPDTAVTWVTVCDGRHLVTGGVIW